VEYSPQQSCWVDFEIDREGRMREVSLPVRVELEPVAKGEMGRVGPGGADRKQRHREQQSSPQIRNPKK
jgi:hypothetical protein